MGLDAAVYRRLEELSFTKEDLCFVAVDARTGQVDFEDAALFRAWSDKVKGYRKAYWEHHFRRSSEERNTNGTRRLRHRDVADCEGPL